MTCKECGFDNRENSRFCANCGAELETAVETQHLRTCPACDFRNKPDSIYCGGCGARQRSHHDKHRRRHEQHQKQSKGKAKHDERKSRFHPLAVGSLIVGGVILLFLVLDSKTGIQKQQRPIPVVESKSNDLALEAKVLDVASKFICSCGTCGEQPLDVCSCNTAVKERQYIRTSLQSGQSLNQVALAVQDNFGWVKPEFSAKIDSLARKSGRRIKTTSASGVTNRGELRIPDKKVRSVVDEKIAEKKHTIAHVIKEVENKYGGRKF